MWLVDDLVSRVKVLLQRPAADGTITDAEIRDLGTLVAFDRIIPLIRRAREDYGIKSSTTSIVSGTSRYRAPYRATAASLRRLLFQDTDGNQTPLEQVSADEVWRYTLANPFAGSTYLYYWEGNEIVLLPTPTSSTGSIVFKYMLRPSKLIAASAAAAISAINTSSGLITAAIPGTITSTTPIDLIQYRPGLDVLLLDQTPTSVSAGVSVTVPAANLPSALAVGDYVALAGETPVIPVPDIFISALTYGLVAVVASALGYTEAYEIAIAQRNAAEAQAMALIEPRNEGAPKKVINRTSPARLARGIR